MGHRFAIYRRISKDRTGESVSPAIQEKGCRVLADERSYDIVKVYTDVDRSAYKLDVVRPEYEAMLKAMAAGELDGVLVWKLDRLMRRIVEFSRFWGIASKHQVSLVSKHDPIDTTTPLGLAVVYLLFGFAEQESYNTSLRARGRHLEIAEAGRPSGGGVRRFGFKPNQITLIPHEADAIREAADRILAGDSVRSIVFDWRQRGLATVTGTEWTTTTVRGLLKSARISGQREHHGKIVGPAVWPAIITPEETAQLRAIFADRSRDKIGGKRARSYLLSGLLICGACGAKMVTRPSHGSRRYICSTDRGGCNGCGINAERLDELVGELVLGVLTSPRFDRALASSEQDACKDALKSVQLLELRLEQLAKDHYGDQLISRSEFFAARSLLQTDLAEAREVAARRQPVDVLGGLPAGEDLREVWPTLGLDRQRAILAVLVESITVAPTEKRRNFFDPDRVRPPRGDIVWRI